MTKYPVLKITLENILKLSQESQNFLNNIRVYEKELKGRMLQIQIEMQNKQK